MQPRLSVVIPARNDAVGLRSAVLSVLDQRGRGADEIVICVGPSDDDTRAVADELASSEALVRVVDNPEGAIPHALNRGLESIVGDLLVRVDAHSELPADYLANALETRAATGAANVGAVQCPVGQTPRERAIAAAMRSRVGSGAAAYRHATRAKVVDTAFLGCYEVVALDAVGGWDPAFERNEDAELNHRLAAAGHQTWLDPRLRVEYRPRSSFVALARQYWGYGWWRQKMARRHGTLRARQLAAPVVVAGLVGSAVAGVVTTPAITATAYGIYVSVLLGAAAKASDLEGAERAQMVGALMTMHLSWGCGFIISGVVSTMLRS